MVIDFEKWNKDFGGQKAVEDLKKAQESAGEYQELPEGTYVCKLEKLELAESKSHKPMVKAKFRITEGQYKKFCIFWNGVLAANDPAKNGFMQHKALEFLRSLQVLDDLDVTFDGDFTHFNDMLLDIAEGADEEGLKFEVFTEKDGDFRNVTVTDVFE